MNRGNLDPLHHRETFGDHPCVRAFDGALPERFVSWSNRKRSRPEDGLHFFCSDDRFEPLWKRPDAFRRWVEGRVVTGPDFSLWAGMPRPMLEWQHYRARWLARKLETLGARVIQSVSWAPGFWRTDGLRATTTVAISAYGAKRAGSAYQDGYLTMRGTLLPTRIVVIGGVMPTWLKSESRVVYYPARTVTDGR